MQCREGKFEEALLHFGMSALAGPLELLRLFPSLAPPQLLTAAAAEQAEGSEGEVWQAQGQQGRGEAAAAAAGGAMAAAAAAAAGQEAAEGAGEEAAEPSGDAFVAAVQVLTPYLLSHRSRLAAAAASPPPKPLRGAAGGAATQQQAQQQQVQSPAPSAAAPDVPNPSPASRAALVQRRLEGSAMAALLDTALLLALLAAPDSGALLRCQGLGGWDGWLGGWAGLQE